MGSSWDKGGGHVGRVGRKGVIRDPAAAPARAQAKIEEARQALMILSTLLSFALGAADFMSLFGGAALMRALRAG